MNKNKGFTLLELSIVLVVIGLISGVVMYGKDIIDAARVRALITQIERYNAAVNLFYARFSAFPGDYNGLTGVPGVDSNCSGDNNGDIYKTTGSPSNTHSSGVPSDLSSPGFAGTGREYLGVFNHLSALGLIEGYFDCTTTRTNLGKNFPYAGHNVGGLILYTGLRITPFDTSGTFTNQKFWHIGLDDTTSTSDFVFSNSLTQRQAFSIDQKIDAPNGGSPVTGAVMAFASNGATNLENSPSANNGGSPINGALDITAACVTKSAAEAVTEYKYNIAYNNPSCQLRIKLN